MPWSPDPRSQELFHRYLYLAAELAAAPASFLLLDGIAYRHGHGDDGEAVPGLDATLVVDDAITYPRPLPGITACIAVPLFVREERRGLFCVLDHEPRQWTAKEVQVVTVLARSVVAEVEARGAAAPESAGHGRLSPREEEVLRGMLAGKRMKEIAFELDVSDKTVATHRFRILRKLELRDTHALLLYAVRHGLVP